MSPDGPVDPVHLALDPLDDPRGWLRGEPSEAPPRRSMRMATPEERISALETKIARLQETVDRLAGQAREDRPAIDYASWRERQFRTAPIFPIVFVLLAILLVATLGSRGR